MVEEEMIDKYRCECEVPNINIDKVVAKDDISPRCDSCENHLSVKSLIIEGIRQKLLNFIND